MNATELQTILDREGVPVEARDANIETINYCGKRRWSAVNCLAIIDDATAENAHLGAMVRWLLKRDSGIEFYFPSLDNHFTVIVASRGQKQYKADTLIEALARACGAVAKEAE